MQTNSPYTLWILFLVIPVLGVVMHWQVFSKDLMGQHVWRQTETQTVIRNFATEDFNILNPRVENLSYPDRLLRKEFPLAQWLIAGINRVLGYNITNTRAMMLVFCWLLVWGAYRLLYNLLQHPLAALASAWAIAFCPIMFYYSVNPLPDVLALAITTWGMALFFSHPPANKYWCLLFFGLAALVKLPFIVFYTLPAIWYLRQLFTQPKHLAHTLGYIALAITTVIPTLAWYAWVIPTWRGNPVVDGITSDSAAGAWRILSVIVSNIVSMLPEWLIGYAALPLFMVGLAAVFRQRLWQSTVAWPLLALFMAVFAYYLYVIPVALHYHGYYLFPFMPFIAILIGLGARWIAGNYGQNGKFAVVFCLVALLLTTSLRTSKSWNANDPKFNRDLLIHHQELRNIIPENATVLVHSDPTEFVWLYYLDRKGYPVQDTAYNGSLNLTEPAYFLADKPMIDDAWQGKLVWQQGSLSLWQLVHAK